MENGEILSVKRGSDGEIFTIGDFLKENGIRIIGFEYQETNNMLIAVFDDNKIGLDGLLRRTTRKQVGSNDIYISAANSHWHIYKGGITMLDGTPAKISEIQDIVKAYYELNPPPENITRKFGFYWVDYGWIAREAGFNK